MTEEARKKKVEMTKERPSGRGWDEGSGDRPGTGSTKERGWGGFKTTGRVKTGILLY